VVGAVRAHPRRLVLDIVDQATPGWWFTILGA
jgi:hypothetical protein